MIINWNNSSKFLWTNKVTYIFAWSNELLIWFKIKISDNRFNFLEDRSLSSIFLSYVGILFHDSTAITVIEYFSYLLVLWKSFVTLHRIWGLTCWSEEKLNHVLKTAGKKLFKALLINNKIFSKQIFILKF